MSLAGRLRVSLKLLLLLAVSACAVVSSQSPENDPAAARILEKVEVVEGIWRLNERVVLEMTLWFEEPTAVDTVTEPSLKDFAKAIEFFEEITGIPSHTGTIFGRVPNGGIRATLAEWNAWFDENKDRVVIEPSACLRTVDYFGGSDIGSD